MVRPAVPPVVALTLVVLVVATAARGQAQVRYHATDIGTLGGTSTSGIALNEAGGVGGRASVPVGTSTRQRPFVYSGGAFTDLGLPPGASSGNVRDLNDRLDAAVNYTFPGDVNQPYVYSGGVLRAVDLPEGYTRGSATAINALGHVAGTAFRAAGGAPYVYAGGVATILDLPPAATAGGGALGINDRGQVLGYYRTVSGDRTLSRAVVWSNGEMIDLAPPGRWLETTPVDINGLGHVLGYVTGVVPGEGVEERRPFIYRDGTVTVLPHSPGGTASAHNALNDRGDFVGAFVAGLTSRGYLYSDGVYRDLTPLAPLPAGFSIIGAVDINNAGQILVRATNASNETRTFVLTPVPEPGAGACAAVVGAVGLLMRRRRAAR